MRFRTLGILLVALMASMGLFAPAAQAQEVGAYVPTGVCVVVGTVQLSDGGAILNPETFPLNLVTGGSEEQGETFTFTTTLIICAGIPTGVCPVNATGQTDQGSPTSGFHGGFTPAGPCTGSGHSCSGNIGGPGILHWAGSPPMPTVDPGFPWLGEIPLDGQWSFTAANLVLGSMDEVSCTGGIGSPTTDMVDGDGLLALTATPIPVPVSGGCEDADLFPTAGVGVYCGLAISGVAVLLSEALPDSP